MFIFLLGLFLEGRAESIDAALTRSLEIKSTQEAYPRLPVIHPTLRKMSIFNLGLSKGSLGTAELAAI